MKRKNKSARSDYLKIAACIGITLSMAFATRALGAEELTAPDIDNVHSFPVESATPAPHYDSPQ